MQNVDDLDIWPNFIVTYIMYFDEHYHLDCLYLQILKSQDLPAKPQDSVSSPVSPVINNSQIQLAPSELENLGQHLDVDLALPGPVGGMGLALTVVGGTAETSSLTGGLDFGSSRCVGQAIGIPTLDPEPQRRLSLQESQTLINSRTPKRHSSDPGRN